MLSIVSTGFVSSDKLLNPLLDKVHLAAIHKGLCFTLGLFCYSLPVCPGVGGSPFPDLGNMFELKCRDQPCSQSQLPSELQEHDRSPAHIHPRFAMSMCVIKR